MKKSNDSSEISLKLINKDTHKIAQLKQLASYLKDNTSSRYMAAVDTCIPIQNVCRYVNKLKVSGALAVVRFKKCRITGEIVEFLSTNPDLFPKDSQLSLWE